MEPLLLRGRRITDKDLKIIRSAIEDDPSASRTAISKRLCELWGWYRPNGRPKDCACREILRSLEARSLICLPAPKVVQERFRPKAAQPPVLDQSPMGGHVHDYGDVTLELVSHAKDFRLLRYLVGTFHYLGLKRTPAGESLSYIAFIGSRPVACLVWASPAFKVACRDSFIGWSPEKRRQGLHLLVSNTRFLILPWARIRNLASRLLSLASKRLCQDWLKRYGHPVVFAETFVEKDRFAGACYKAANWSYLGDTRGRGKYDRLRTSCVPVKAVFVRPLHRHWKVALHAHA